MQPNNHRTTYHQPFPVKVGATRLWSLICSQRASKKVVGRYQTSMAGLNAISIRPLMTAGSTSSLTTHHHASKPPLALTAHAVSLPVIKAPMSRLIVQLIRIEGVSMAVCIALHGRPMPILGYRRGLILKPSCSGNLRRPLFCANNFRHAAIPLPRL